MVRKTIFWPLIVALAAPVAAVEMPPNMTTYYFGVLMRGPKYSAEKSPERAKIQEGHMAWMDRRGIRPDPLGSPAKPAEPK